MIQNRPFKIWLTEEQYLQFIEDIRKEAQKMLNSFAVSQCLARKIEKPTIKFINYENI